MNYISSAAANGSIGYDEYSYALAKDYPVAKVLNKNGYFALPTQYNVAVALTQAQINTNKNSPNYLLQDLQKVYTYNDSRTYPLSSYSYGIIPTASNDQTMTTAKRQTLADYLFYSVCQGQKEMGPIGYSPLPLNLVQASFDQIGQLKKADKNVNLDGRDVASCGNPTFIAGQPNKNHLARHRASTSRLRPRGSGTLCRRGLRRDRREPAEESDGTRPERDRPERTDPTGTEPRTTPTRTGPTLAVIRPDRMIRPPGGNTPTTPAATPHCVPTDLSAYQSPQLMTMLAALSVALLVLAIAVPPILNRRMSKPKEKP